MKTLTDIVNPKKGRFFYRDGEKILLNPITNKVLVKFNDNTATQVKKAAFDSLKVKAGLVLTYKINDDSINGIFHLMDIDHSQPAFRTAEALKEVNIDFTESSVNFLENVFENTGSPLTYLALTNQLFIKLKSENDLNTLQPNLDKYGIIKVENMGYGLYLLTVGTNAELDALDIANQLFESGSVEFADPNFFRALRSSIFTPNDPEYYGEWHIPRIGADAAWCWTNGAYG